VGCKVQVVQAESRASKVRADRAGCKDRVDRADRVASRASKVRAVPVDFRDPAGQSARVVLAGRRVHQVLVGCKGQAAQAVRQDQADRAAPVDCKGLRVPAGCKASKDLVAQVVHQAQWDPRAQPPQSLPAQSSPS
jgi:hypothetical protein